MWCRSAVSFSFGFLVAACRIRSAPPPVTCEPGPVSGACFGFADSPWFRPFAPSTPQERVFRCSPTSQLLCPNPIASTRSSSIQIISFLPRPRHDCRGELKPSRVPARGVRASLDSSDNAEPGRPSPWRFCRYCLRPMRKPRHSGPYHFRCSIIPATRAAADASTAPSRVRPHGSRWK